MANSIETLLARNFYEIFGERDASKRQIVMTEILTKNCLFTDSEGVKQGSSKV